MRRNLPPAQREREALHERARHDGPTALPNHERAPECLARACAAADRGMCGDKRASGGGATAAPGGDG